MKHGIIWLLALGSIFIALPGAAAEDRPTEISVGYLLQWPTPAQFSQTKKTFDSALGLTVNWVPFAGGDEMNAALAENRLQIAYAQDIAPFVIGVSRGQDLTMIGIAAGYRDDDNCILADGTGFARENLRRVEGLKVAVRIGSLSHYRLLKMLEHLGIDPARIEIIATGNDIETASALQQGDVVMACASGKALRAISTLGKPLMSGAELEAVGLRLFDTITVRTDFMVQHAEIVQAFMDVVSASNEQWRKNPEPMRAAIARAAQMGRESASRRLETLSFPTVEQQKSASWMGSLVATYSKNLAEFFVAQGRLDSALESYDRFITTRFLR